MGEAKRRRASAFSALQISSWESRDCIDFAIALARETGWLIHLDWATNHDGSDPDDRDVSKMVPLRTYVADDIEAVFDVRGILNVFEFTERIVAPLGKARMPIHFEKLGITTRFYDEQDLCSLPLRFQPDEDLVTEAHDVLRLNPNFLSAIPARPKPSLSAKVAAKYTWGLCSVYAQALEDLKGVPATALVATGHSHNMQPKYGLGYVHSLCLHPDGLGEDSWGKQPIDRIARRFMAAQWRLDRGEHLRVVENHKRDTPDGWDAAYQVACSEISSLYDLIS